MGKTILPTKLVFKIKQEHDNTLRYKSRLVSKGFYQIPGIDYTQSFSPVAMDTSIKIQFGITLYFMGRELELLGSDEELVIEMFDTEAAFLNSKQETPCFIEVPPVMVKLGMISQEEAAASAYQLLLSMYGNVDAALMYNKMYKQILQELG